MASNANKLKQARAYRGTAINRMAELYNVAKDAVDNASLYTLFQMRYEHINTIYDDFNEQHGVALSVLSVQESEDIDAEEEIRSQFDDKYYTVQSIYYKLFKPNENSQPQAQVKPSNIKLPKISIPIFNGDISNWPRFFGLYSSLIHKNNSLSNSEKFQYLLTYLDKEPLLLIKNIPVNDENYTIAFDHLYKRFQNTSILATHYWDKITDAPKLTTESPRALRQLIDTFNDNISALKNLKYPTEYWDFILFRTLLRKLDSETIKRFELQHGSCENPTYNQLQEFLLKQCNALDSVSRTTNKNSNSNKQSFTQKINSHTSLVSSTNNKNCSICDQDHLIYKCPIFNSKSPKQRYETVKQNNWCTNCLGSLHTQKNCNSISTCKVCKLKHHSLLHFDRNVKRSCSVVAPVANTSPTLSNHVFEPIASTSQINTLTNMIPSNSTILLSTAQIEVLNCRGHYETVRVLLDSASQANFITAKCANRLGLPRSNLSLSVNGLGQMGFSASSGITCTVRPQGQPNTSLSVDMIILPKICSNMPSTNISICDWEHLANLKLADPHFNFSGSIDMLLGADIFPLILRNGLIPGNSKEPTAINTIFGWIMMGKINNCSSSPSVNSFLTTYNNSSLDSVIKRFWELEAVPEMPKISPDDALCEKLYVDSHFRDNSGRFTVSLPFSGPLPSFINSRSLALKRFHSLENRLLKNPSLYKEYCAFMKDYLDNNHMTPIKLDALNLSSDRIYYIPHHCVLKLDSTTTKLRVVFDASSKCPVSLNDTLLTGPKLQQDIVSILMNFRLPTVVFTADIKQMYRQILITESHRDYHRILWRFSPNDPVQDFHLNTVTYGVSSAPFLAIRSLIQLADDEKERFPLASAILAKDTYVDDVVCGCDSLDEARRLQSQLISLLKCGGFELRKWASNQPTLLNNIPPDHCQTNCLSFDNDDVTVKILGLKWLPTSDTFFYEIAPIDRPCTKRTILSEMAKVFDPLGFLTPLTFFAKHLIQILWSLGLQWDESPPSTVLKLWIRYKSELSYLTKIIIPRHIVESNFLNCELHGFADASSKGYAAAAYVRFLLPNEHVKVYLVCAKSKVAPLKTISIPRLELCAAVLLSKLMKFCMNTYSEKIHFSHIFAWTDSMVVLSWIKSSPHRWKTFVSNRVSCIQENISPECWHHVLSTENPADCASRGLFPSELVSHNMWWSGPTWLSTPQDNWPKPPLISSADVHEEERKIALSTFVSLDALDPLLNKYSSLSKIKRIIAYSLRFIHNLRHPTDKKCNPFTIFELHQALLSLVKRVQHLVFAKEISNLENKLPVTKTFRKLHPFLDKEGLLRVGGRLFFSGLSYDHKFPLILPRNHRLTELIIEETHRHHLHPGLQTLQFLVSQQFWILSPRRAIRHVLSKCLKCFRAKPSATTPFMGDLPSPRVNQVKPFQCVGVDFGGPYFVTLGKRRGIKSEKAYICLFVCFATKAIHLELVSDLSSDAFLAALRRFISRRGRCTRIFSDCGTNFVGAARELSQFIREATESEKIEWSFNPPSAPHFGGLWESGIKAVKTHLIRVVGNQILTYEEFYTVLVQIEAVLNSRPLCPLSSDPSDLSVLTPGHFLTLEPLTSFPDPDLTNLNISRLNRWQLVQRLHQDFWKRWHAEYLQTLQQRNKWAKDTKAIEPGMLVLIKNEQTPPLYWRLGRVVQTHPGHDGICRTATVKTTQGLLQRPVVKLCPLPSY